MPTLPPKHRPAGWRPTPKFVNPDHAFYGTQAWKRLREFVRKRDGGICARCGRAESWRVDHIIPRADGGPDDQSNLQLLCDDCDAKKHREKGSAFR
jgi:5-methylcytosine-specific restriction protein A